MTQHHTSNGKATMRRTSSRDRRARVRAYAAPEWAKVRSWVISWPLILTLIGVMMLDFASSAVAQGDDPPTDGDTSVEQIETTREALAKWVDVQKTISRERRQWRESKQMLKDRIDVVKREIASLREKIAEAEQNITETDKERQGLIATNDKLKAASTSLEKTLMRLERRTKGLAKRLPAPAMDSVDPLIARLPDNPENSERSLQQRFPTVVGILNELNAFNNKITAAPEVRELSDDRTAEVTTLYIGLGQAYYVGSGSGKSRVAGYGAPGADGWTWQRADHAAQAIADAVAIYEGNQVASFIRLPIELRGQAPAATGATAATRPRDGADAGDSAADERSANGTRDQ